MYDKKSVLSFGLLLSSLVMLSAIPLLSSNNNPAMAQGYDDYYSDSYSTYSTDDKKYECRTGPFEGFFVSSVEFCKFNKFDKDDRKDNRDNKTGAQGPQLNDANTYQVTSGEIVNNFTSSTTGVAICNNGDFVINGGFTITGVGPNLAQNLLEIWNKPFYTPVTSGWDVFIFPTTSSGKVIYLVHATCFDNSP